MRTVRRIPSEMKKINARQTESTVRRFLSGFNARQKQTGRERHQKINFNLLLFLELPEMSVLRQHLSV